MGKTNDDLSEWLDLIRKNEKDRGKREKEFMDKLGSPCHIRVIRVKDKTILGVLGYWRASVADGALTGGVYRAQEGPNGWRYDTLRLLSDDEINALVKAQKTEGNSEAKKRKKGKPK